MEQPGSTKGSTKGSSAVVIGFGAYWPAALFEQLASPQIHPVPISQPDDIAQYPDAIDLLVLDQSLAIQQPIEHWRSQLASSASLILGPPGIIGLDMVIAGSKQDLLRQLQLACTQWLTKQSQLQLERSLAQTSHYLERLSLLGIALSAEKDLGKLLEVILAEGMKLGECDAASLFLVDRQQSAQAELVFRLAMNASIDVPFHEQRLPLSESSLVGYVALNKAVLNIPDAYRIPDSEPYQFNRQFDCDSGYRTVSLLALPMCNYRGEVVGVLEFINCKHDQHALLTSEAITLEQARPFSLSGCSLLQSLASLSAVAIENNVLIGSINRLFDSFVQAAVTAIEQRDPSTCGHSFRVADLSVGLAQALPMSGIARLAGAELNASQLRELRYAALLHDFGKVGVRETVLTKAKKLTPHQLDLIAYRLRLKQERLKVEWLQQHQGGAVSSIALEQELARLDGYLDAIMRLNEPSIEGKNYGDQLEGLRDYPVLDLTGNTVPLLEDDHYMALSIRQGSLNEEERLEIQSHVNHTLSFLERIPWTPELSGIPAIAAAHHEKLDGSGYPFGLSGSEIPLAARIMTVCDIFDALTANDRPYKDAVPCDYALDILCEQVRGACLDGDLVSLFIEAEIFKQTEGRDYQLRTNPNQAGFHHHVCDLDFHNHHKKRHSH